jgi:hypothetical protein
MKLRKMEVGGNLEALAALIIYLSGAKENGTHLGERILVRQKRQVFRRYKIPSSALSWLQDYSTQYLQRL